MISDSSFWRSLAESITINSIILDRPKGAAHPHYPDLFYPLDYGYLKDTPQAMGMASMYGWDQWMTKH